MKEDTGEFNLSRTDESPPRLLNLIILPMDLIFVHFLFLQMSRRSDTVTHVIVVLSARPIGTDYTGINVILMSDPTRGISKV